MTQLNHGESKLKELKCKIVNSVTLDKYSFKHSKDVRLPVQLQRAMAAEAEAAREARAKVKSEILQSLVFCLT